MEQIVGRIFAADGIAPYRNRARNLKKLRAVRHGARLGSTGIEEQGPMKCEVPKASGIWAHSIAEYVPGHPIKGGHVVHD
jgi:hypothetical protein